MKNLQIILLTLAFAANCMGPDEHEQQRLKRAAEGKQENEPVKKTKIVPYNSEDFSQQIKQLEAILFEGLNENPQNINEYFSALPEDMKREIFKNISLDLMKSYINSPSPNKNKIFLESVLKLKTINKDFKKLAEYYIPEKNENEYSLALNENLLTFAADRNWINFWNLILDNNIIIDQEILNDALLLFISNRNYYNKNEINLVIDKLVNKGAKVKENSEVNDKIADFTLNNINKIYAEIEKNEGQIEQVRLYDALDTHLKYIFKSHIMFIGDFDTNSGLDTKYNYAFLKFLIANGLNPNSSNFITQFMPGKDNPITNRQLLLLKYEYFKLLLEKGVNKCPDINNSFRIPIKKYSTRELLSNIFKSYVKLEDSNKFASINSKDEEGQTVLFNTLERLPLNYAQLLIERGADINIVDHNGRNALFATMKNYCHSRDHKPKLDLEKKLDLLIYRGLNINTKDNNGETILFKVYDIDAIELLLQKYNIDPRIKNNNGETALFYLINKDACKDSNLFEEKILLFTSKGANINEINNSGQTILFYFLEKVASKEIDLKSGKKAIKTLLKYRIQDIQDNNGQTALFRCTDTRSLELTLPFKPKLNIKDKSGKTVLDYFNNRKPNKDVLQSIEMLRAQGAKLSSELNN